MAFGQAERSDREQLDIATAGERGGACVECDQARAVPTDQREQKAVGELAVADNLREVVCGDGDVVREKAMRTGIAQAGKHLAHRRGARSDWTEPANPTPARLARLRRAAPEGISPRRARG